MIKIKTITKSRKKWTNKTPPHYEAFSNEYFEVAIKNRFIHIYSKDKKIIQNEASRLLVGTNICNFINYGLK